MLRYSRYFIVLFFTLTVFPLVLMFSFHQHQAKNIMMHHGLRIFNMGFEQLNDNLNKSLSVDAGEKILLVDIQEIFPAGPFELELYRGDSITRENLVSFARDRFAPIDPRDKHGSHFGIPKNNHAPFRLIPIKSKDGTIAASLLFKMTPPHKPPIKFIDLAFVILVLGLFSSLIMGFCLKNIFLVPLVKLSDALKRLQKGDYSSSLVAESNQKELKKVFESFDAVVKSLQEKEELRTNFISNLTHDLRTPLIAQEKTLELISKEFMDLGMEDTFHLSKSLEKNNKHLLRMVNLILEAYRFDAGDLKLNFNQESISDIISDCFCQLEVLANDRHIKLENKIPRDIPAVFADRNCLNRVFINLVSNSIANTPEYGEVKVDYSLKGDFLDVKVRDNGNGISEQDLKNIFDRYYVGQGYERNIGSGLGLYVCKELIKLHKGEISVISEKGKFTEFLIKLPIGN